MNNVNMANMSAMGGPVGGGMPMMNNGMAGAQRATPVNDNQQRSQLNTYIYEYFLRNEMYECARAIIQSEQPINVMKNSPGRRRDGNGNLLDNGVDSEGMEDSKDDIDSKRPEDLPAPNLPKECPESCFLYEWWCLFWDMFNAQRGKGDNRNVLQYVQHTQTSSRNKQEAQQNMLRAMQHPPPGMNAPQYQMMLQQQNRQGNMMQNDSIARKAMQNNGQRQVTPQQLQLMQQKQAQMVREGSDIDNRQQRPSSPGASENAPSPKRQRLDGAAFNGQQMPNGRGQPQGLPGQQVGPNSSAIQATQALLSNGINPNSLTSAQFQQFTAQNPAGQTKSLQAYTSGLMQHQQSQMPNKGVANPSGPQSQGSPMMNQGQDSSNLAYNYNPEQMGANGMRGAPGQPGSGGGNHALQDYQMQLMLLEQQNKKRLMMARQEQDSVGGMPREGPGGPGPNGQPFQGSSPQGARTGSSPNPNDQMKRGTPQMNSAGIPSPLPEGQSRNSPGNVLNFMSGQMDPSMPPHFYKQMNGMEGNMVGTMPNGMRPPSSHPGGGFPMSAQQIMSMRQQQQQAGQVPGWQTPSSAPMMQQQPSQGPAPQNMGTPQQRPMQPPPTPAPGAPANGRTQPPSPPQNAAPPTPSGGNKANPKKKADTKSKRNTKKANTTTGATPATDGAAEPATPTPATPITPVHPQSFAKNGQAGGVQNAQNVQVATAIPVQPPQPEPTGSFGLDDSNMFNISMDFANPTMGTADVLQDFDFDSFLHQDAGDNDNFSFDASAFMEGGEVGAE